MPGGILERRMKICAIEARDSKRWILGLASSDGSVAAEVAGEPEDKPADQGVVTRYYEFRVRGIAPKCTDLPLVAELSVQTASESKQPLHSFLVTVRLVPTIRAVPDAFIIPKPADFPVERKVLFIPKDGKGRRLGVVSELPAWLSVVEDQAAGNLPPGATRFLIQVNRPAEATVSDVTVEFRSDDDAIIKVPVRFAGL